MQFGHQLAALAFDPADQLFVQQGGDHGIRAGTGCRMPEIGMAMLEEAASRLNRPVDVVAAQHRPDRLVTGT